MKVQNTLALVNGDSKYLELFTLCNVMNLLFTSPFFNKEILQ